MLISLQDSDFTSSGWRRWSGTLGSYDRSLLCLENLQVVFHSTSPTPLPTLTIQCFPRLHINTESGAVLLVVATLTGVKWYCIGSFMCVFLIISEDTRLSFIFCCFGCFCREVTESFACFLKIYLFLNCLLFDTGMSVLCLKCWLLFSFLNALTFCSALVRFHCLLRIHSKLLLCVLWGSGTTPYGHDSLLLSCWQFNSEHIYKNYFHLRLCF